MTTTQTREEERILILKGDIGSDKLAAREYLRKKYPEADIEVLTVIRTGERVNGPYYVADIIYDLDIVEEP